MPYIEKCLISPSLPRLALLLAICLFAGALVSISWGQDANWDLRNYHLYIPINFIRGDFDRDFLAAGLQTYFNPTLDFPYAILSTGILSKYPRILAGFMGLWYGGLIFVVWRLAVRLFKDMPHRQLWVFLGTLMAVTGAATLSQVGTTTNEVPLALFVLMGLFCILRAIPAVIGDFIRSDLIALGGLLFGVAAGLKLTVCVYAFALCLSLFVVFPIGAWLRSCFVFSVAWLAGFLPFFSWWGVIVWKRFSSPTFPLFNGLFKSPFYPPSNFFDERFFPRSTTEWLFYPYLWAFKSHSGLVSELSFRDPRMALAMTMIIGFVVTYFLRHKRGARQPLPAEQRLVLAFLIISYIIWLFTTSILRYAIVIEVLSVFVSLSLIPHTFQLFLNKKQESFLLIISAIVCGFCLVTTHIMDWGHVSYGKQVYDVDMNWVEPNTLFVSITGPTAYLAAFIPDEKKSQFVGFSFTTIIAKDFLLRERTQEIIKNHQGPIVVLVPHGMDDFGKNLPVIGLSQSLNSCRIIHSNLDEPRGEAVQACEAKKISIL